MGGNRDTFEEIGNSLESYLRPLCTFPVRNISGGNTTFQEVVRPNTTPKKNILELANMESLKECRLCPIYLCNFLFVVVCWQSTQAGGKSR